MADSDIDFYSSFVWGETSGLKGQGDEPEKAENRLWSVLTYIATKARPLGLIGQMKRAGNSIKTDENDAYKRMKDAIKAVVEEKYDGAALPQQAALWQIDAEGRLLNNAADGGPTPPTWIFQESAKQTGEFVSKTGARFRLYELVDPPALGKLGYASAYSSTGLAVRKWTVPDGVRKIAWVVGSLALVCFIFAGVLASRTGRTDGAVRAQMTDSNFQYDIINKLANNCIDDQKLFPNVKRTACSFLADASGIYVMPPAAKALDKALKETTNPKQPVPDTAKAGAQDGATEKAAKQDDAKPQQVADNKEDKGEDKKAAEDANKGNVGPGKVEDNKAKENADKGNVAAGKTEDNKGKQSKDGDSKGGVKKDVLAFGGKVGETLTLVRKCLNVGIVAPATEQKPDTDAAVAAAAAADEAASCTLIARSASGLVYVKRGGSFLDQMVTMVVGGKIVPGTRSILWQLFLATLGIGGLAVALGLGTKGRVAGIWIDERNRVSLARAQVTLWTIVALGGYATIALFNIGLGAPVSFPQIPAAIAAALGIAFSSPMISALILNSKSLQGLTTVGGAATDSNDFSNRGAYLAAPLSGIETRADPTEASLADVFMGETVSESASVDISRLQNVVLTITLLLGYFAMLIEKTRAISSDSILSGLPDMPDPGAAFTAVLLVSHATYLGTKAYKTTPPSSEPVG